MRAKRVTVERRLAEGHCPECNAEALARYEVLSHGGWFQVLKCQACLASVERKPWARYGHVLRDYGGNDVPEIAETRIFEV